MDKPSYYAFPALKKTRDPRRSSIPRGQEKDSVFVVVRIRAAGRGGTLPSGERWRQGESGAENPGKAPQGLRGELIRVASEEKES